MTNEELFKNIKKLITDAVSQQTAGLATKEEIANMATKDDITDLRTDIKVLDEKLDTTQHVRDLARRVALLERLSMTLE